MKGEKKHPSYDWRRQGQEKYLKGVELKFVEYSPFRPGWDHDHCEFCGSRFSLVEMDLKEGWSTEDKYRWVCQECFIDFKDEFSWEFK